MNLIRPLCPPSFYKAQAMGFIPPVVLAAIMKAGGKAWEMYQKQELNRAKAAGATYGWKYKASDGNTYTWDVARRRYYREY